MESSQRHGILHICFRGTSLIPYTHIHIFLPPYPDHPFTPQVHTGDSAEIPFVTDCTTFQTALHQRGLGLPGDQIVIDGGGENCCVKRFSSGALQLGASGLDENTPVFLFNKKTLQCSSKDLVTAGLKMNVDRKAPPLFPPRTMSSLAPSELLYQYIGHAHAYVLKCRRYEECLRSAQWKLRQQSAALQAALKVLLSPIFGTPFLYHIQGSSTIVEQD